MSCRRSPFVVVAVIFKERALIKARMFEASLSEITAVFCGVDKKSKGGGNCLTTSSAFILLSFKLADELLVPANRPMLLMLSSTQRLVSD